MAIKIGAVKHARERTMLESWLWSEVEERLILELEVGCQMGCSCGPEQTCPRMLASTSTEKTENDLPVVAEGSLADRCVVVWLRGAPKRRFRVGCWNDAWRLAEHRHCLPVWQGPLRGHGFHPRHGQARPQQRAVWHWTSSQCEFSAFVGFFFSLRFICIIMSCGDRHLF